MGRAETTPRRGFEQDCEGFRGSLKGDARDYLHDLLNPSLLERECQEKSGEDNRNSGSDPFRERFLLKDLEEFAENQYGQLQYGSSPGLLNPERLSSWDQQPDETRRDHSEDRETSSHHLGLTSAVRSATTPGIWPQKKSYVSTAVKTETVALITPTMFATGI